MFGFASFAQQTVQNPKISHLQIHEMIERSWEVKVIGTFAQ